MSTIWLIALGTGKCYINNKRLPHFTLSVLYRTIKAKYNQQQEQLDDDEMNNYDSNEVVENLPSYDTIMEYLYNKL